MPPLINQSADANNKVCAQARRTHRTQNTDHGPIQMGPNDSFAIFHFCELRKMTIAHAKIISRHSGLFLSLIFSQNMRANESGLISLLCIRDSTGAACNAGV